MRRLPSPRLSSKPATWYPPDCFFAPVIGLLIAGLVVCFIMLMRQPTPQPMTREAFERQHAKQTAPLERISTETGQDTPTTGGTPGSHSSGHARGAEAHP